MNFRTFGNLLRQRMLQPTNSKVIRMGHTRAMEDCGKKLYYKDVLKLPDPLGHPIVSGFIIEAGTEAHCTNLLTGIFGCDVREAMQEEMNQNFLALNEADQKKVFSEFEDNVKSVNLYTDMIDFEPIALQEWTNFKLDGIERPGSGKMDLRAMRNGRMGIIDWKRVITKSKPQAKPAYKLQLALYALHTMKKYKLDEIPWVENHIFYAGGKAPVIVRHDLTAEDMYEAVYRQRNLHQRLEMGYFPLNRQSYLCKPNFCAYYERCHFENFETLDELMDGIAIQ